jgi:IMP dehydrogenase
MEIREGLTFDDVLLVPQHSEIGSRATDIDLSIDINGIKYQHPIIPANMQSVTGEKMAEAVFTSGGLALLHRFMPLEEQLQIAKNFMIKSKTAYANRFFDHVGFSVGVKENYKDHIKQFSGLGVKIFCIDIAHGDSLHCVEMTNWIRQNYPQAVIIAGNVATGGGAARLWEAGADIVKVGVGPGSLCTTRIETGNGVPQLTALMDVFSKRKYDGRFNSGNKYIIADGGIKNAGDIVKALCFADMVMAGNIFAGCVESPGSVLNIQGKSYKEYKGSSTHKSNHVEGVMAIVPTKGKYENILKKLLEGIRSGCSYQGANNLIELKDNPQFIRITSAGLTESHPHDVII